MDLVRYFLAQFGPPQGSRCKVLDPFAGAGTTLTTAAASGWQATGIELLPVAVAAMRARLLAEVVSIRSFKYYLKRLETFPLDGYGDQGYRFPHLRITEKAFPLETEDALCSYAAFLDEVRNPDVRYLFRFACLSILEDVSYTRKDGQYLRWDCRSGRPLRSNFRKRVVHDFRSAICRKLRLMLDDIETRNSEKCGGNVRLIEGSCLSVLPTLPDGSFNLVVTSPPYCNRYDYTRTYALELAFLGYREDDVKNLRQELLSATVENKSKREKLAQEYRSRDQEHRYLAAVEVFRNQRVLQEVLNLLYGAAKRGRLNNKNIPNLVENYFFEMNMAIRELSRVLAPGGKVVMVNDNVQYNGEEIPVDLILSDLATRAGLSVDRIWLLPRGKGNSSQQMGTYGRKELRKCVYVWSKPGK